MTRRGVWLPEESASVHWVQTQMTGTGPGLPDGRRVCVCVCPSSGDSWRRQSHGARLPAVRERPGWCFEAPALRACVLGFLCGRFNAKRLSNAFSGSSKNCELFDVGVLWTLWCWCPMNSLMHDVKLQKYNLDTRGDCWRDLWSHRPIFRQYGHFFNE